MLTQSPPANQFSLQIIAAVITGFCALLLFFARRRNRGMDPLTWWAISMALTAGNLLATAAPRFLPATPAFVTTDVAGMLLLLGAGASWMAARAFTGRPVLASVGVAGAVVWLLTIHIGGFDEAPAAQAMLLWAISAAYAAAVIVTLWPDRAEKLPSRPLFLLLTGLYGAAYLVHAILAACGIEDPLQDGTVMATVIDAQLRSIGISFLALALTKERAELLIARSRDIARDAGEARRRFLAQMSHEVRTPLNGVLGLAQVLLQDSRLLPGQRQHVASLEAAGRHLLAIVNDALDLAKIDAGQLAFTIRPFNPADAVDACLSLVRPAAEDRQINLHLLLAAELPAMISGDTTRMQQILLNLLWNAVKFTPPDGTVTLRIGAGAAWLRCEVIDTGPGVPVEKRAILFQDFGRVDPNGADGTGLGLAISARLAERMGGRLTYHPGPGGTGSLFRVELPWPAVEAPRQEVPEVRDTVVRDTGLVVPLKIPAREEALPEPANEQSQPAQSQSRGLRLLVVDDVRTNRSLLRALMTSDGHNVTEAENGAEAVALAARDHFDAILMDVRMPVMDGIEATRRIRKLPGEAGTTPIIAVSADVMPETVRTCLAVGMSAMVAKPIDRDALLTTLRRLELHPRRPNVRAMAPSTTE